MTIFEKSRHPVLQTLPIELTAGPYIYLLTRAMEGKDVLLYAVFLGLWSMIGLVRLFCKLGRIYTVCLWV